MAVVHPLFWGVAERQGPRMQLRVERLFGGAELYVSQLELPAEAGPVTVGGRILEPGDRRGAYTCHVLRSAVRLRPGAELVWETGGAP